MLRLGVIGLGNRAGKYLCGILDSQMAVQVSAVAETDRCRLGRATGMPGVDRASVFTSAEGLFEASPELDAVIIATPDRTHFPFAMRAIGKGWHVLLEKPVATSWEECLAIEKAARENNVIVSVCYVLRFHPLYMKLKDIVSSGGFGRLVSASHRVDVGADRMTHTFVRGLWSREESSSPIILSKASHDIDILYWLTGEKAVNVSSHGSLEFFTGKNAPHGSADRCVDCPIERQCRFSAVDLYSRRGEWTDGFDVLPPDTKADAIARELRSGRYGRCVFRCDNDVLEHQTVDMMLENGAAATIEINGLAMQEGRHTFLEYENGEVEADGRYIRTLMYSNGCKAEIHDMSGSLDRPFHSGADIAVVKDFLEAVALSKSGHDAAEGIRHLHGADISSALHSHEICFRAESSRLAAGKWV